MTVTFVTIVRNYAYGILVDGMRVDTAVLTPAGYTLDDGSSFSCLQDAQNDIVDCIL